MENVKKKKMDETDKNLCEFLESKMPSFYITFHDLATFLFDILYQVVSEERRERAGCSFFSGYRRQV